MTTSVAEFWGWAGAVWAGELAAERKKKRRRDRVRREGLGVVAVIMQVHRSSKRAGRKANLLFCLNRTQICDAGRWTGFAQQEGLAVGSTTAG
jgi:hypothetical protein